MGMRRMQHAQKFDRTDKATIRGRVKHTRTGACSCKRGQKCYHAKTPSR